MKYDIDKKFGIFRYFSPSLNKVFLSFANIFLSIFPRPKEFKKKTISSYDNKKINFYSINDNDKCNKVIIYIHGGGFVMKASPHHFKLAKEYALKTNSKLYFIDYRLALQNEYNTPYLDCMCVYKYIQSIHPNCKFQLAGDSAGGFIAASLCKNAIRDNITKPDALMLIYPVIDPNMTTKSMKEFHDTPLWNSKLNRKMWNIYNKGNVTKSLLESKDFSSFPKTYIETAEFDCLKDEAKEFYDLLIKSNVNTTLYETKKTMHGYDICIEHNITKTSLNKRIDFLNSN